MEERSVNQVLQEALLERYDQFKNAMHTYPEDSDEYKAAKRGMGELIQEMQTFNKNECDYWAKQEERRIEEEHNEAMIAIEERKLEEHNRVERERNEANLAVEREKRKISWQRVAFEFGLILVPLFMNRSTYFKAQGNMLEFEKTGRVTSTVGRELHLPKIFGR